MTDDYFEPNAMAAAKHFRDRFHREVELLVTIAASPLRARSVLRDLNITVDWFDSDDTRCLFCLLEHLGQGPNPVPIDESLKMAMQLLKNLDFWDPTEERDYLIGRWGPGPLIRLFHCCDFDPVLIQTAAIALREEVKNAPHLSMRESNG